MDVLIRLAVPVGVVRSLDRPDWSTVIVKVTYDLGGEHWPGLAAEQVPLDGTDFATEKAACDVVLVGSAAEGTGPMRLCVGEMDRSVPVARMLGALSSPDGQQFAPVEQRIEPPRLPLDVVVASGGFSASATLRGPTPEAALADADLTSISRIPLSADTILVDVTRRTATVVYRGSFCHPVDLGLEVALVVDALGRMSATPVRELKRWPCVRPSEAEAIDLDSEDLEITRGGTLNVSDAGAPSSPLAPQYTVPAIPLWATPQDAAPPPAESESPSAFEPRPPDPHDARTRPMPSQDLASVRRLLLGGDSPSPSPTQTRDAGPLHTMPTVVMEVVPPDLSASPISAAPPIHEPEDPETTADGD